MKTKGNFKKMLGWTVFAPILLSTFYSGIFFGKHSLAFRKVGERSSFKDIILQKRSLTKVKTDEICQKQKNRYLKFWSDIKS